MIILIYYVIIRFFQPIMHKMAVTKNFLRAFFVSFMIILSPWQENIVNLVRADSPSFVRQEIIDSSHDWIFWKGSTVSPSNKTQLNTHEGDLVEVEKADNSSECEIGENGSSFSPPDIQSVSYISDGKKLNATVWLTSPFKEPPLNDTIDTFQEEIKITISRTNGTLREYTDVNLARLLDPSFGTEIQENATMLSGNQAHRVVYNDRIGEKEVKVMQTWTVIGNKAYDITYTALPTKYEEYLPTIEDLIGTFEVAPSIANNTLRNQSNMTGNSLRYEASGIKLSYPFDWFKEETKNNDVTTILFRSPFEDTKLENPSWHEITFTMAIDIDSVHDAGTDYRVIFSRIPYNIWTGNWTRLVQEISAYDNRRILEEYNQPNFYDEMDPSYILFSFDLNSINSPKQYKAVFYATDYFVKDHLFCTLTDTTNWVIIPPPDFSMSVEPRICNIETRRREER